MAIILCALVAAAVRAVVLQKAVQTIRGLFYRCAALFLRGGQQKNREQHVLGTPARPVAHGFRTVSHPPEVACKIGRQDAGVQLPLHPRCNARRGGIQFVVQQVAGQRQQRPGLGGKKLYNRLRSVRQGQLRGVRTIAVVGRQLPCAFLAERPYGIRNGIQKAPRCALRTRRIPVRTAAPGGKNKPPPMRQRCRCG